MSEPPAPRKASEYVPRALNPFLRSQSNPRGDRRRAVVIVPNRDGAGLEMVSPRASEPVTPRSATAGAGSLAVPNGRASRSGSLTRNRSDSFAAAMKNLLATASPLSDRPLAVDGKEADSGPVVGAPFQLSRSDSLSSSNGTWRTSQTMMLNSMESRLEVTFMFPDGQQLTDTIPALATLDQVREYLQRLPAVSGSLPQPFGLKAAFTDHYFSGGDMLRSVKELPYVAFCTRHNIPVRMGVVSVELQTKEQRHFMTVQRLLGRPFPWTFDNLEAFAFRSHFYQQLSTREPAPISCEARTTNSLMTLLPSTFIVQVNTTLPEFRQRSSCINANRAYTAADVIRDFCRRNTSANPEGVLVRVSGRQEYIFDDRVPLINIVCLRECLKRRQRISLELVSRAQHSPAPVSPRHDVSYEAPPQLPVVWDSLWDKHDPVSLRVAGAEIADLSALDSGLKGNFKLFIDVHISNVGTHLASSRTRHMPPSANTDGSTSPRRRPASVLWDDTLNFALSLANLPRTARLTVVLMARPDGKRNELTLASGHVGLFDWRGMLLAGHVPVRLAASRTIDLLTPLLSSSEEVPAVKVNLFLPSPERPLLFPRTLPPAPLFSPPQPSPEDCKQLRSLLASDPLYEFDAQEASLVWRYRDYCKSVAGSLIKILACVPWTERLAAQDIYRQLDTWPALDPRDALGLLDRRLVDPRVRAYAVRCLRRLPDNELEDLLLQMIQVLRYEPHHFSALACFLLERAHKNRIQIGASFYWHAKSELDSASPGGAFRYLLLLDAYLRGCGSEMDELLAEAEVVGLLRTCALHAKDAQPDKRKDSLQAELANLKLPPAFRLPLLPTIQCAGLRIAKCKTMDSAKVPLWLVFENSTAEAEDTFLIFKEGDDLRQDMLTLQILNVMDRLWQSDGLDLHLTLYRCIATGHMSGMIQVVLDSQTIANIQGTAGGAFDKRVLDRWLREKNASEEEYLLAVENFIYSCAGYCVATYVLGVGDRHNDNIMLSTNGHLFHIDFGHFLGNFKKFLGLKRENVPFVFTPEFAYIMGGEKHANFARFVDVCCQAFAVLRRHSNFFINLFAMMLSTGMPELKTADDLGYLKRAFMLDADENRATAAFKKLIFASMNDSRRRLDNAIHILAHK